MENVIVPHSSSSNFTMEKEKASRKKSSEKYAATLPIPPPDPLASDLPEAFKRIIGYKEREMSFFKSLRETIQLENKKVNTKRQNSGGSIGGITNDMDDGANKSDFTSANLTEECDNYMMPLLKRTGPSISAALVTEGAIDQLDKLHGILEQLLHMQEQNYKLRRSTRDIETLHGLKKLQKQVSLLFFFFCILKFPYNDRSK